MKKVLIIEDDLDIAELEKDYLQLNGFHAEIVQDGADGLEMALSGRFDIVVVDLMLPRKNGYEIIRRNPQKTRDPGGRGLGQKRGYR